MNLSAKEALSLLDRKLHDVVFRYLREFGSFQTFRVKDEEILLLREMCGEEGLDWDLRSHSVGYWITIRCSDQYRQNCGVSQV